PLRNIFRNPRRSLFMATGVMSATAMILVSMSFLDMMDYMIETQFEEVQDYDARVIFQGIGSESTATYIEHLDGIEAAEAVLTQPYRIKFGKETRDIAIRGLQPDSTMYYLLNVDGDMASVSDEELLLPKATSDELNAGVGDTVHLEPLVGTVGETEKRIAAIINEPLGSAAYLSLEGAQKLFNLPGAATGVFVKFYGDPSAELLERIYNLPEVASIEQAAVFMEYFDDAMAFFWAFIGIMLAMSFGLGLAIVFNGVTVNVLERRREIAIMRAIGMSDRQLTSIITVENLSIGLIGILVGLPAGYQIANFFMVTASESVDNMAFTAIIYPRSYVIAAVCSVIILLVSQMPAIKRMTTMSLPTVTKDWSE
ncbi:MAG: ABC transporter permease, partial [Dehalococcoidia bacterium]|nr:ABC transporter permease [Dehalococcoidia bacterium]